MRGDHPMGARVKPEQVNSVPSPENREKVIPLRHSTLPLLQRGKACVRRGPAAEAGSCPVASGPRKYPVPYLIVLSLGGTRASFANDG